MCFVRTNVACWYKEHKKLKKLKVVLQYFKNSIKYLKLQKLVIKIFLST